MTSELLLTSSLEQYIKLVCPMTLFLDSTLTSCAQCPLWNHSSGIWPYRANSRKLPSRNHRLSSDTLSSSSHYSCSQDLRNIWGHHFLVKGVGFIIHYNIEVETLNSYRYLARYKTAFRDHSTISEFVSNVDGWFNSWSTSTHSFDDGWKPGTEEMREHQISVLRRDLERLCAIVLRETAVIHRWQPTPAPLHTTEGTRPGLQLVLLATYAPPGDLSPHGPRHDNDHADIREITIEPSEAELISTTPPCLPANIPDAPHHLRAGSMERVLDIQFRLLREEFL